MTMTSKEPAYIFELRMKVRDYEIDAEGIVNNAHYLHYFEHTRHEFCQSEGLSFAGMRAIGIDPVVRHAEIDYLLPLRSTQEFTSRLALRREGVRFIFSQAIYHYPSEQLAAKAEFTIVALREGRPTRGDELAEAFSKYL